MSNHKNKQFIKFIEGDNFKGRYPGTPCEAINGVLPLYNIYTQVCNQHGGVQEVQHSSRCKEIPHCQLKRRKDLITT
jgi:hypothetical protein